MIDEKFNREFLEKIKEEKITPKPKWHFLLKNYLVWGAGLASLIIGGVAFSVVIYLTRNNDWDAYKQAGESFGSFILLTIPYFWLVFLGLFVFLVYYNVKHTKNGYRYPLVIISLINVVASIVLGGAFYFLGVGRAIDEILGERAPFYGQIINQRMGYWINPEEGRLAGVVVSIESRDKFILLDLNKKDWWVVNKEDSVGKIIVGEPIKMIGKRISENVFEAEQFFPALGPGGGMFRKHQMLNMGEIRDRMIIQDQMMKRFASGEPNTCLMNQGGQLDGLNYLLKNYQEFGDFLNNNPDIKKDLEDKRLIK